MTVTTVTDVIAEVVAAANTIVPDWALFLSTALVGGFLLRFIPRAIKRFM